ncbi:hypothetical protein [Photobacterium indicum]|uniref:hypothetical protein n=1 Tax=Photobacterium indicum TaxID=81447 RepID=UPI003D1382DF
MAASLLFTEEQYNVRFINKNGVPYDKKISCADAEILTAYIPSEENLITSNNQDK